jgi:GNAT superfamily N-acetyltransferase
MRSRLPDVISVYKEAFLDNHEPDPVHAARDRSAHARRHTERRDLRAVAAVEPDGRLVGVTYALPGRPGQWWHDVVTDALDAADAEYWLGDCLEIVELHVLPSHQGRGIGRALLRELVSGVPHRTAALSALDIPDSPARRLYSSEGFVSLLTDFYFPGSLTPYAVLGKHLTPPTGAPTSQGNPASDGIGNSARSR